MCKSVIMVNSHACFTFVISAVHIAIYDKINTSRFIDPDDFNVMFAIILPLIYALSKTNAPRHSEMVELSRKDILEPDDIATLIEYAKEQGGIDYAYSRMEQLKQQADEIISRLPHSESLDDFRMIFSYIISRRY